MSKSFDIGWSHGNKCLSLYFYDPGRRKFGGKAFADYQAGYAAGQRNLYEKISITKQGGS